MLFRENRRRGQLPGRLFHIYLFLSLIFPSLVSADYQTGLDAYTAGNYHAAMTEWKAVASQQPTPETLAVYRESLYAIAMLYWQGEGVEQDYSVSTVWLKQAADINHPGAQVKLGYLYSMGLGVPQNYEEAAKYFQMAAMQGDSDAKHNLEMLNNQGLLAGTRNAPVADITTLEPPPKSMVEPEPEVAAVDHVADLEPVANLEQSGADAGENWILQQNPEYYTIQVIALSHQEKLQTFIAGNPDWSPFAIYRQTRYEKRLWVMVQGVYPDVESARVARDAFPAGIQKREDLWIRKFEMVQRLIE